MVHFVELNNTVNPLSGPLGGLFISSPFEVIERGAYFILEKATVPVLHKDLDTKWKSSCTRPLEVMQPRIRIESELPVGEQTIRDQSTQSLTVVTD